MRYRNWKTKNKFFTNNNKIKNSKGNVKYKDEIKSAYQDEKRLKRKKKRLSIDWFFRPRDD